MPELAKKFYELWTGEKFLRNGETAVVGVSGGPDSIALLHLMWQIHEKTNAKWKLCIAHLNHLLRGKDSDTDAEFVGALAKKLGIRFVTESLDVAAMAEKEKLSIETAARNARRDFFMRAVKSAGAEKVFLAHNADDQAETIFMRLVRGTGLQGLNGMCMRSVFSKDGSSVEIIRPLLSFARKEIMAFIESNRIPFRTDKTNDDTRFTRNMVRKEVLPFLEKALNPNAKGAFLQIGKISAEAYEYILMQADFAWKRAVARNESGETVLDIEKFNAEPPVLRREILRRALCAAGADFSAVSFKHIESILVMAETSGPAKTLDVPGDVVVHREYNALIFARPSNGLPPSEPVSYKLEIPGETAVTDLQDSTFRFCAEKVPFDRQMFKKFMSCKTADEELLDADALGAVKSLEIRLWRDGDEFSPLGMEGSKMVGDYFIDAKVPVSRRRNTFIVLAGGRIVWVAGQRLDNRFRINDKTGSAILISIHKA